MKSCPGILLAGMHSSSGKTAVTCLILAALRKRGHAIQPFKAGPDFIDPGFHAAMAGVPCRNLDAWISGRDMVIQDVKESVEKGRLPVIEGVMGLFDGSDPVADTGSTLELARDLDWPVILVIPCAKAARSLNAAVRGFMTEAGPGRIRGLILNQVSGDSHLGYLRAALAPLDVPILGAVPKCSELNWPERHLGLQSSTEMNLLDWTACAELGEKFLDVDALLSLVVIEPKVAGRTSNRSESKVKIGVARDEAFHFYYTSNLEFLEESGAELMFFSPLHDKELPDVDAVIIGGGFPEIFADRLSTNRSFRESLRLRIKRGLPCYAECGGFMYLTEQLVTLEGGQFTMVGVVPGVVEMTARLQNFGYCHCESEGKSYPGHEFHHSVWHDAIDKANLWRVRRHRTGTERMEGYAAPRLHASYIHLDYRRSSDLILPLLGLTETSTRESLELEGALV
jgi:cobyrinic acid a,c-diamide synthase